MRTKNLLLAVALPTLFAACTADEFVQAPAQDALAGRALLNPNFAINVVENPTTKFAWENLAWSMEEGDQFGGAVVNPADMSTIESSYMLGNYIWSKESGSWGTTSQMIEGTYMFYSYDGFITKNSRELVKFDLTGQKADLSEPEATINDKSKHLMFSPLYKIDAETSAEPMPLEFRSYFGVAAFHMKNNTGEDLTVSQIILKDEKAPFVVKGGVNPKALNDAALKYVYNKEEGEYVYAAVDAALNNEDLTAAKRADAIKAAEEAFAENLLTTDASVTTWSGVKAEDAKTSSYIALDCQGYEWADGETVIAYMLVPAHASKDLSVEIMVIDENEEAKKVTVTSSQVTGLKTLQLKRDKTNLIFGKKTTGADKGGPKVLNVSKLEDGCGYYVDSNEALLELLDQNLGTIKIYNSGSVVINEVVAAAINEYTGGTLTFANDIEVKSEVALTDEDEKLALSGVIFNKSVKVVGTIKADDNKTVIFTGTTVWINDVEVEGTLTVEAGADVTLIGGKYATVENSGAIMVETSATTTSLTNIKGTMTVEGDRAITAKAGTVTLAGGTSTKTAVWTNYPTLTAGANVSIQKYAELTLSAENKNIAPVDGTTSSTLTNLGTIKGGKIYIDGELDNQGKIESKVEVYGSLINSGEMTANVAVKGAAAKVKNSGEMEALYLTGELETVNGSRTVIGGGINGVFGKINNTAMGKLTGSDLEQFDIYYNFNGNAADLEDVNYALWNINALRVNGTLTFTRNFTQETANRTNLANLKKLILADGAKLDVQTTKVTAAFTTIEMEGCAAIEGVQRSTTTLELYGCSAATIKPELVKTADKGDAVYGHILTIEDITLTAEATVALRKADVEEAEKDYEYLIPAVQNIRASYTGVTKSDGIAEIDKDGKAIAEPSTI